MKTVYLVRHGQSEGNVSSTFQVSESPLTEHGKRQAAFIAERCAKLPIEVIISSNQLRAKSTAEVIAAKASVPIEFSALFRERKKPSTLEGKSYDDPDASRINEEWLRSLVGVGPRVSDGESFEDLSQRAAEALDYVKQRPEKDLLVVTHGFFMRYIAARAMYGAELTSANFRPLAGSLVMENTGMTVLRYDVPLHKEAWDDQNSWQLWIWNDHAHLG